ncbi:histidine kinase [Curvibacter sp. CHRR-16]|uniref:sensor histidine kinase n=1 Tax=Curvibacter sp. CHRR-16 TaxID=2835872 RepID=UPI001BD986F8|nr:histidine kinase [Curvibacter sp. CHRR-16]MBT0570118.1 histidine kinase [Curvibacter sp. CHRR-16]
MPKSSLPRQSGGTVRHAAARLHHALVRGFHAYASWLVSISWWRFILLAVLFWVLVGIVQEMLPSQNRWSLWMDSSNATASTEEASTTAPRSVEIVIGDDGLQIQKQSSPSEGAQVSIGEDHVRITAPASPGLSRISAHALDRWERSLYRTSLDRAISSMVWLLIVASIIIKISYQGRIQAEAVAAAATETAETETLKRQVMEARLAAMQAQVEPHFLFNTLASIEHLIETDAPRAARMQRSLIHFLREAMPTLREANAQATRDLGRELAVVLPYLDILRMRMDERLQTEVQVPEGLHSALFPPMVLQSLVENAIRHGLEPQADGGLLRIAAVVNNGQLEVSVSDTGLGFSHGQTSGTGVGLANIRERLQLLYGQQAELRISTPAQGGSCVTVCVPYQVRPA